MIKPLVAAAVLTAFAVPSLAQTPIRTERVPMGIDRART